MVYNKIFDVGYNLSTLDNGVFKKKYLGLSLKVSIAIQIISGVIQFFPMFMNVSPGFAILKQLLVLENVVQVVQATFYIWLYYNIKELNITSKRYYDWVITTPLMLITLMCYIIFLRATDKDRNKDKNIIENMQSGQDVDATGRQTDKNQKYPDMYSIIRENYAPIIAIVLLNAGMLLFGYLGETNRIPIVWGILVGFIPFIIYYYIIYVKFVKKDDYLITDEAKSIQAKSDIDTKILKLFLYFVFFWSLYGVIGFLPYYIKNTLYNIIDLFSKNFFGLLLSYLIYVNSRELSMQNK
jgi:hypothetical protein